MAFKGDLETLILGTLQVQALHGYEIAKQIKATSKTVLNVAEGQLYPSLHKLEEEGLVTAVWQPQEGKPPRKVYCLTEAGRAELVTKRTAWESFSQGVNAVLLGSFGKEVNRG